MSYDQTFKGSFTYADERCLEAGLDRFVERTAEGRSIVGLDDLRIDGLVVHVAMDTSAPASMYDETTWALRELGATAKAGTVKATFELDGISRETLRHGGQKSSQALGPRHHGWEIWAAAKAGDADRLAALREHGLVRVFPGEAPRSSLQLAAASGSVASVTLLLDAGADPNASAQPGGVTALGLAANAEVARALLDAGADLDQPIWRGNALSQAIVHGRADVALALLEHGATLPKDNRADLLDTCLRSGQLGVIQRLLRAEPKLIKLMTGKLGMEAAIRGGHTPVVDFLLERGAKLPNDFLALAVGSGSVALTQLALAQPGAVAACGASSKYADAMVVAARGGSLELLALLTERGVPVTPAEPGDTSPLHALARADPDGARACVEWLLDHGAPIDGPDARGTTPLRAAVEFFSGEVAEVLLERGADLTALKGIDPGSRKHLRKHLGTRYAELVPSKTKTKKP